MLKSSPKVSPKSKRTVEAVAPERANHETLSVLGKEKVQQTNDSTPLEFGMASMESIFGLNSPRLLLVEDDLPEAERTVQMLRGTGYYVQNAYNIGDALAADHNRFNLALVNAAMHDRQGTSILELIERHPTFSKLPLLLMSNNGKLKTSRLADHPVLHRPYSADELRQRIEQRLKAIGSNSRQTLLERLANDEVPVTLESPVALDARLQQQLAELKTLSQLGRSISSVLELSEVLNQIVEAATTLTHAEEGLLMLPDDEGKALYLRAMKGLDDQSAHNFRIKAEDPLLGRVFMTGQPVLLSDRGGQRIKTEYFAKSLLYVPMTYKAQTIGVLGVNNRLSERNFSSHDQELLLDLAAYAAIAIENAKLYEERLVQNRQLGMLIAAAKAVNSTLALGDVLSTICQQLIQTLEVNACLISQQDNDSALLQPLAGARRAVWRSGQGPSLAIDSRPVLHMALEQNAFYAVTRKQRDEQWQVEQQYLQRSGAAQMLVLPIRPGAGPVVAILELFYHGSAPEVTNDFRATLRSAATEILAMVSDRMTTLPTYNIFNAANKILENSYASWMSLSVIHDKKTMARVVEYGAAVFLTTPSANYPTYPHTMTAFSEKTILNYHIREDDLPDEIRTALGVFNAQSMLSLPLMIKDSPFGAVTIFNTVEARRFRPREVALALALVTQAATAIENARLYNDVEQSIAELRQTQAKLVQTARLSTMGELSAVVAHQINNPLTTIMVDSELILSDLNPDDQNFEGVTAIHRAGKRAHAVVKRLLSNARRSDPDEPLVPIEVHETIFNTLELVTTHIERSNIRFDVQMPPSRTAYVMAAPGHLEDLWLNLLLNARDALAGVPDALIKVSGMQTDKIIRIIISDNGPGIPGPYLEQIFNPFFTTKPSGEGTGLGLYICKQIVDKCKGTIRVETEASKGATFVVELPLAEIELEIELD
jgi:signal transduction histidine kinase/DNA-binding response OmpR family regulator